MGIHGKPVTFETWHSVEDRRSDRNIDRATDELVVSS